MIDPTRLAAIKALKPTPGPWRSHSIGAYGRMLYGDRPHPEAPGYEIEAKIATVHGKDHVMTAEESAHNNCLILSAADPEYGLQALAAEVERLQEREKPVTVLTTGASTWNCGACGVGFETPFRHCPGCGRKQEYA